MIRRHLSEDLITLGIDRDIKLFAPAENDKDQCPFNKENAIDLMNHNAVMLKETKDTIPLCIHYGIGYGRPIKVPIILLQAHRHQIEISTLATQKAIAIRTYNMMLNRRHRDFF